MSATERKVLETIAGERCPCGHLKQRHRKPVDGPFEGMQGIREVLGKCRDCNCAGVCEFEDDDCAAASVPK